MPVVHINGKPYRIEQTPYGRQLVSLKECGEIMPSETQRACIRYNEAMQRKIGRALQGELSREHTNPLPKSISTRSASNTPLHQRPKNFSQIGGRGSRVNSYQDHNAKLAGTMADIISLFFEEG